MATPDTNDKTHTITHTLGRRTLLAAAVSTLCVGAVAPTTSAWGLTPVSSLVTLQVVDRETGEVARVWRHAGKLYVAGQPGARYSLRVTNNSGGRLLAVVSVDGVNIVTGETAAYNQRGYVLRPYETHDINGWRKSNQEIAAFNFAPLAGSYAARTGRPDDVGVIGVAAFREREAAPVAVSPPVSRESRGAMRDVPPPPALAIPQAQRRPEAPAPPPPLPIPPVASRVETPAPPASMAEARASLAAPSARLGTGHGEREWSRATFVNFERASAYPSYVYRLEYDSQTRLIASGVIPRPRPSPQAPSPFPGNRNGFVPDPPYGS